MKCISVILFAAWALISWEVAGETNIVDVLNRDAANFARGLSALTSRSVLTLKNVRVASTSGQLLLNRLRSISEMPDVHDTKAVTELSEDIDLVLRRMDRMLSGLTVLQTFEADVRSLGKSLSSFDMTKLFVSLDGSPTAGGIPANEAESGLAAAGKKLSVFKLGEAFSTSAILDKVAKTVPSLENLIIRQDDAEFLGPIKSASDRNVHTLVSRDKNSISVNGDLTMTNLVSTAPKGAITVDNVATGLKVLGSIVTALGAYQANSARPSGGSITDGRDISINIHGDNTTNISGSGLASLLSMSKTVATLLQNVTRDGTLDLENIASIWNIFNSMTVGGVRDVNVFRLPNVEEDPETNGPTGPNDGVGPETNGPIGPNDGVGPETNGPTGPNAGVGP